MDFYCAQHRLVVEVDGEGHGQGEIGRDEQRDADLSRRGVQVLRFTAADTMREIEAVLDTILAAVRG